MKYFGVNLGGWLVLERWITPSVFEGLAARDETSFCHELGIESAQRLEQHRKSFITEADLVWLRDHGVNALRLPLPHWVFGDIEPYVGCVEYVDWLLDAVAKHDLAVLLDLHTAPGSQNGNDHSGLVGRVDWPESAHNIQLTLTTLERIANRWGSHKNVMGIELLNEPSAKVPHTVLAEFYADGIKRLWPVMPNKLLVVSDAFRPTDWADASFANNANVVLDMHLYQAFDKPRRPDQHIKKARTEWRELITKVRRSMPVMVGEWSLGLEPKVFRGLDDFGRDKASQAFSAAQLESFSESVGCFFWTYKTETMAGWSLRDSINRGWLRPNLHTPFTR